MVKGINDILPENIFNFEDWYLAGGCVYSIWNNREVKDYDLFCKNKHSAIKVRRYFRQHNEGTFTTDNAITCGKYQFITIHVGQPEDEVRQFDFKHNMFYYDSKGLHNCVDWKYIDGNKLEFNSERARDVLNIMTRIPKFVARDMEISQKEMLDILEFGTRPSKIRKERKTIKKRRKGKDHY